MTIDLQPFCADSEWSAGTRHDMTQPWTDGAWRYAADGAIIVRMPADPGQKPDRAPDAASLFSGFLSWPCLHQLPTWDGSLYEYHEKCDHPQCHGGKISGGPNRCPACGGHGETPERMDTTVEFQGFNFGGGYMQKIHALPGVKGYVKPLGVDTGQLHFIFNDDGQGILMNTTDTITTKGIDHVESEM